MSIETLLKAYREFKLDDRSDLMPANLSFLTVDPYQASTYCVWE
jgi:hypothetical protein